MIVIGLWPLKRCATIPSTQWRQVCYSTRTLVQEGM